MPAPTCTHTYTHTHTLSPSLSLYLDPSAHSVLVFNNLHLALAGRIIECNLSPFIFPLFAHMLPPQASLSCHYESQLCCWSHTGPTQFFLFFSIVQAACAEPTPFIQCHTSGLHRAMNHVNRSKDNNLCCLFPVYSPMCSHLGVKQTTSAH